MTGLAVGSVRDGTGAPRSGIGVVVALGLGPAVALGLARFAYALLLPAMVADLHLSFASAGALNTANAVGYLVGALCAAPVALHFGNRRAFVASMAATAVALIGTAVAGNIAVLGTLRMVAGVSGAITFITGASLVAQIGATASTHRQALLLGIYFAGGGAGIVLSGLALPPLLAAIGAGSGWRWGWALLAALAALAVVVSAPAALGSDDPPPAPQGSERWPIGRLTALLTSYALFGAGYIAYMTFSVAFLKADGAPAAEISIFWVVLGTSAIGSAFLWAPLLGRLRGGMGTAIIMAVLAVGAILPLVSMSLAAVTGSAILFGGSFLAVATAVTAVARQSLPPHHWTRAIAAFTVVFAVFQCVGPVMDGAIADAAGGLRAGLGVSAAILAAGAAAALAQR